ncbi:hypothetical protein Ahy_B02g060011 [Arachis hypogaea]|uniref:Ubiquitin-like protease family profile domain-containing protein n=1 Tax=Arachis hypogaea TaxID=3818 RepID=A0A445AHS2_ARAHY|nr:hypothetical protein Ahy_B02g060011 [Arachis hypogaea]
MLADAVMDAGVTTALKFAEGTSAEQILSILERWSMQCVCFSMKENVADLRKKYNTEIFYHFPKPQLFISVCHGGHWWLWIFDVKKKAFYVLDPIKKKKNEIPQSRITLNKFVGLIVSQMGIYAGAEPLMEDEEGVEAPYITISGQRTFYDYDIYVMKWLEIIDPKKINKGKYKCKS